MPHNYKPVNKKHTEQALKDALKKRRELGICLFFYYLIINNFLKSKSKN